jgi:hypothetical protein
VRFAVAGRDRTTAATIIALSENGILIRSDEAVPAGSRVACGFYVLRGQDRELVLAKGSVARSLPRQQGGPGIAVRIEKITIEPARLVECLAEPLQIAPKVKRGDNTLRMGGPVRRSAAVA